MLKLDKQEVRSFGNSIIELREKMIKCKQCNNISDQEVCSICSDTMRDHTTLCIVESIRDVMAIENTGQYKGIYFVLHGVISPMDGIGPTDLDIDKLTEKVQSGSIKEVILALGTTMEGDTTNFFIYRKLEGFEVTITTLARGVAIGDDLEYADEITLGRSIVNRTPFEQSMNQKL
jgi:recombination protein RecR